MKKLLIIILAMVIANLCLLIICFKDLTKLSVEVSSNVNLKDTAINRVQIDSITFIIHERESVIYNIIKEKNNEINKVDYYNDSTNFELFKELLFE